MDIFCTDLQHSCKSLLDLSAGAHEERDTFLEVYLKYTGLSLLLELKTELSSH